MIQSVRFYILATTISFTHCRATEAKVSWYKAKLFPSSCFEVLVLRELQESSQPADGGRHNGPT